MISVKRESYSRLLSPHFPAICVKIQFLAIFHRLCLLVGNPLIPPPLFLTKICHWVLLQCYGVVNKKVLHKSEEMRKNMKMTQQRTKNLVDQGQKSSFTQAGYWLFDPKRLDE